MSHTPSTRVLLHPTTRTSRGQNYEVSLNGETIVQSSRDPEHDAARALLARGITGRMETASTADGPARMRLDIKRAAKVSVCDRDRGLWPSKWAPFLPREALAAV